MIIAIETLHIQHCIRIYERNPLRSTLCMNASVTGP